MAAFLHSLRAFAADYPITLAWLETAASALATALVTAIACRLAWAVAARLARHRLVLSTVLRFVRGSSCTVVVLLMLEMVWEAAPDDLPKLAVVEHATTLALTIALAWLGTRSVAGLAEAIIVTNPLSSADNLHARRLQTQTRVLARTAMGVIFFLGIALALMSFPAVRNIGTSLLASAGVAGLVVGIAARPALGNLIAGLQLALTQPIRLDDVVIIEGEWGRIEEIGATNVVVKIWDERRLVVPLQWFLEHAFQNWTLSSSAIIGTVFLWADYRLPVPPVAAELERLCRDDEAWDQRVCLIQVTDANEHAMQLRALVSSADASLNWDLRCRVRAGLVAFIQERYPQCLPQTRLEIGERERRNASGGEAARRSAPATVA